MTAILCEKLFKPNIRRGSTLNPSWNNVKWILFENYINTYAVHVTVARDGRVSWCCHIESSFTGPPGFKLETIAPSWVNFPYSNTQSNKPIPNPPPQKKKRIPQKTAKYSHTCTQCPLIIQKTIPITVISTTHDRATCYISQIKSRFI